MLNVINMIIIIIKMFDKQKYDFRLPILSTLVDNKIKINDILISKTIQLLFLYIFYRYLDFLLSELKNVMLNNEFEYQHFY